MNTKIIVALVIGIALIGLTGAAQGYIYTYTDIYATHLTSESELTVSGMPIEFTSESLLVAELIYPTYPPVDMSWSASEVAGSDFSFSASTYSSPTGSSDEYEITNPNAIEGYSTFFNCAMLGLGIPQQTITLPTETNEPGSVEWSSSHLAGLAYPTSLTQSQTIYWP